MKNTFITAIIISLLLMMACRKTASTNGGNWTLNHLNYTATQAFYVGLVGGGGITAYTGTNVPTGSLTLSFYDSFSIATVDSLEAQYKRDSVINPYRKDTIISVPNTTWPPKLSSYILTNTFPPDSGYVYMQLTDSSIYNSYTTTGSSAPVITITKAANGLMTFTIPPVMVVNTNTSGPTNPFTNFTLVGAASNTDSSLVTGKVIQTQ